MLFSCPIFTTIGGLAHMIMCTDDFSRWPVIRYPAKLGLSSGDWRSKMSELAEFVIKVVRTLPSALYHPFWVIFWFIARLSVSAITGLAVGLYFLDVIPNSHGGIGRIYILSMFIGYHTPTLLRAKEQWVLAVIESDVFKAQLGKAIKQVSDDVAKKENGNTP